MNLQEATILAIQNKLTEQIIKVYHGTDNIFNKFKNIKNGIGYWFSTDKEYASEHGEYLLTVTLNLDNILDLEVDDDKYWSYVEEFFGKQVDETTIFNSSEFGKFLNNKGYDALSWKHNDGITYVVFNPENLEIQNLQEEYASTDFVDDFYWVTVYKICMDTYTGKRLYLAQNNTHVMNWKDAKVYEWQFNPAGAMEFDSIEEAENFAKKYFKNFRGWYVYETKVCR